MTPVLSFTNFKIKYNWKSFAFFHIKCFFQESEKTLTPVDVETTFLDEKHLVEVPLQNKNNIFTDCHLSSISDENHCPPVVKRPGRRARDGREKKRVSFHETVVSL